MIGLSYLQKTKFMIKGFTLIEVLISLALIVVTLLVFGVAISTIPLTRIARNQNVAYHIAAKKLEELRNTPYASLPSGGNFNDSGLSQLASSTAYITVSDYQGNDLIKHVIVDVGWFQENDPKHILLETLITDHN